MSRVQAQEQVCPDPRCGRSNPFGASYCSGCGRPLVAPARHVPEAGSKGVGMRSVGVAYGLWALCIVGVAGIHRFYLGRYVTGLIWLLTWGVFGIGLLVDLFLIPGMTERKNYEIGATSSWQRA